MHPDNVRMEATEFSDTEGDSHFCTDWETWGVNPSGKYWEAPCATSALSVRIHLGDGSFVGWYSGRRDLEIDQHYTLRVRFHDDAGEPSGWSQRSFSTYSPITGGDVAWTLLQPGFVLEEVACGLQLPLNLAFVPNPGSGENDPVLYETELYGTIKVVTRSGGVSYYANILLNFNPTGDFPGSGEDVPVTGDGFASLLYDARLGAQ